MARADQRLWASTRGQLLNLLRGGPNTVGELAAALKLTPNAVRSHLRALERDGLARPTGTRRGPRKPAVTYALSPEAERLFPKEYGPVLRSLLDELQDRLTADQLDGVMRATGRRFARAFRPLPRSARPAERAARAAAVLQELGGCCVREAQNGSVVLSCSVCPLGVAADGHPEVCRLVETLLADVVAGPVRNRCRADPPRCQFEVGGG
jgi:predicted ArsR family transcriptional regulator